jgi:hypothetical protein
MARARAAFGLCAALGIAGLAVVLSSMFIALARVNIAAPTTAGLIAACRGWVLPHGGLVALSVLGLGSLAVAVVVLTMRSALRQVHATRRFERGLRVVGCLPPAWPRQRSRSASSTSCACSAIRSSSVAARHSCRRSPKTFGWTWSRPGRSARA